jgi:hypothetical protein
VLDNTVNCQHCGAPLSGFDAPLGQSDIPIKQEEKLETAKAIKPILVAVVILGIFSIFSRTFPIPLFLFFIIFYVVVFSFRKNIRERMNTSFKNK